MHLYLQIHSRLKLTGAFEIETNSFVNINSLHFQHVSISEKSLEFLFQQYTFIGKIFLTIAQLVAHSKILSYFK